MDKKSSNNLSDELTRGQIILIEQLIVLIEHSEDDELRVKLLKQLSEIRQAFLLE